MPAIPDQPTKQDRVHDFLIKELGRAVPYGIYDLAANAGWASEAPRQVTQ
jgi:hypothetical protein